MVTCTSAGSAGLAQAIALYLMATAVLGEQAAR